MFKDLIGTDELLVLPIDLIIILLVGLTLRGSHDLYTPPVASIVLRDA